ncbi:hypothetical protein [Vannielia litorea]|uniref:GIY-YIG nuclease family protein n=1 Tax=Vannielia litorea TaxID=1217970 RepID=A0A1N6G6Z5_9RHOB|nr:hypothetical protein [Vannielia litorea]SIO03267.1 hypothetical protein SAMN05444002_2251 [Vannielia litorea]
MIDKRAARSAAKERPDQWVIYSVRTGGEVWVGATPNLSAAENRLRFQLRMGSCIVPRLQAAHDGALQVERLEALPADLGPLARQERVKSTRAVWAERLGAVEMRR